MYAIVELGGRQWKVEPGNRLSINRVSQAVGEQLTLEQVLFAADGEEVKVGRPYVSGAQVVCEILEHHLGDKVISFHYRRRENWRKKVGHRQPLTRLLVKSISVDGKSATIPLTKKSEKPKTPRVTKKEVEAAKKTVTETKAKTRTAAPKKAPAKKKTSKG